MIIASYRIAIFGKKKLFVSLNKLKKYATKYLIAKYTNIKMCSMKNQHKKLKLL